MPLFVAGQNIGLCNGKLKAMSGEELDQLAEAELSSTVQNVMALIVLKKKAYFQQLPSNMRLYLVVFVCFSGFHFLQDKSEAQAKNNKGTKSL